MHVKRTVLIALLAAAVTASPAAAAGPAYVGAQVHPFFTGESAADVTRDLNLLTGLGVNAARVDVGWSSLQGDGPDGYAAWYVAKLDAFVGAAARRGIKVIATLDQSPCWASSAPASLKQGCAGSWWDRGVQAWAPSDPAAYARAARFLTDRYGTRLAALEIWNEPNHAGNFRTYGSKPARYAALVRATYRAAKAGDRRVPVLAGAMAYSDVGFLRRLYAAGIAGSYDGISLHPYSDGRPPLDTSAPARLEFGAGIRSVRDAQRVAGQLRPLWLTEFGYTACDQAPCASLSEQASLIGQSVAALGGFAYVRGASLYQLRDAVNQPSSWEANFGLVRFDFSKRPAYGAFRRALQKLRSGAPRTSAG